MAGVGGPQSVPSPSNLSRSLDRVLDDAQYTGEIKLSGRKLKEYPKGASKYDLSDTVLADLSKNRFGEVPPEISEYRSLEVINLYHNVIKTLPPSLTNLQSLTQLNLSRNQLTTIPLCVTQLKMLRVLDVSGNRLVSLPEEIGQLTNLMELDASYNQLAHLPSLLGDLQVLRRLNLRRNLLQTLPVELCYLRLVLLDLSGNKISHLPTELRFMSTLVTLLLEANPLHHPPASLCTRGRVHIFKWLEMTAAKEEKKRVPSQVELRNRKFNPTVSDPRLFIGLDLMSKRNTVDSGYGTSENGDHNWANHNEDHMENGRDQRHIDRSRVQAPTYPTRPNYVPVNGIHNRESQSSNDRTSGVSTPSTLSPGDTFNLQEEFEKEMKIKQEYESIYGSDRPLSNGQICNGNGRPWNSSNTNGRVVNAQGTVVDSTDGFDPTRHSPPSDPHEPHNPDPGGGYPHHHPHISHAPSAVPTYRDYLEAKRQQRAMESNNIYRRVAGDGSSPTSENGGTIKSSDSNGYNNGYVSTGPRLNPIGAPKPSCNGEESWLRHPDRGNASNSSTRNPMTKADVKNIQKEAVLSYIKSRVSPTKGSTPTSPDSSFDSADNSSSTFTNSHSTNNLFSSSSSSPLHSHSQNSSSPLHSQSQISPTISAHRNGLPHQSVNTPTQKTTAISSQIPQATSTPYISNGTGQTPSPYSSPCRKPPSPTTQKPPGGFNRTNSLDGTQGLTGPGNVSKVRKRSGGGKPFDPDSSPAHLNFTYRRELEKQQHERQLIQNLRNIIETRLKVTLPADIGAALMDGVVLCHLANHVRPRSVSSIHVPSLACPKLTVAKCRLNVENFLEACRKIGVEDSYKCTAQDILEERGAVRVAITVERLLKFHQSNKIPTSPKNQTSV